MSERQSPDGSAHTVSPISEEIPKVGHVAEYHVKQAEEREIARQNKIAEKSNKDKTERENQEKAFLKKIDEEYSKALEQHETRAKIVGTMRSTASSIGKFLLSKSKLIARSLKESYMTAINSQLVGDIESQEGTMRVLARLEIIIYEKAEDYFTEEGYYLDYELIEEYIHLNKDKIKNMIKLAYKLHYKLLGRDSPEFNDSLAIMYIVHLKCQNIVDYTSTSYTRKQIEDVIKICLKKKKGTFLPEGAHAPNNSKRIKIEAPGFKLVQNPVKEWRKEYDDGRLSSPTNEEKLILNPPPKMNDKKNTWMTEQHKANPQNLNKKRKTRSNNSNSHDSSESKKHKKRKTSKSQSS
jgi:hypothetical protein